MATILITGANRGIGLALTEVACKRGDRVIATCRTPVSADRLSALAKHAGEAVTIHSLDVADGASVAAAARSLGREPIDILINNAGVISPDRQTSLDMDFEGWAGAFAINAMGPLRVAQAFLPNLRAARQGRIVAISSAMGSSTAASGDHIAYRSTKAALNRAMQGLAADLKREKIAVLVMHPGWVRTDMGGRGASLAPRDSALAILAAADRLDLSQTGQFRDIDGRQIPW